MAPNYIGCGGTERNSSVFANRFRGPRHTLIFALSRAAARPNPRDVTDPLRLQLQQSLGSAYTLGPELGGGGMSRVFVAREEALDRDVVVKVLAPELAEGLSAERFEREIKVAAALQNPHILPVLASGSTPNGLSWYTMPFVAGESLRGLMDSGEVILSEALAILRDIATALEAAHARGIVHRDIKPENVLLSGRTAVVTDFGIAKALAASKTRETNGALTQVGTSLGTPAYMAPEQAAGDDVDERTDLYAWGVIAYELMQGKHPFAGKRTSQQFIVAHITEEPETLEGRAGRIPTAVSDLIMRCLEKEPDSRPRNAREILDVLANPGSAPAPAQPLTPESTPVIVVVSPTRRGLAWGAGAAVAAALAIAAFLVLRPVKSPVAAAANAARQGIAVLPFENVGDSADAYFADGITDEVRGKLAAIPGLKVIARSSAGGYRHTTLTPGQIAQELGVSYLLTGRVRWQKRAGGTSRVRVDPELMEVSAGSLPTAKWSQPFDAELVDVFKVQSEIASKVAGALNIALGAQQRQRLSERPTANLPAYDAYLQGEAATQQLNVFSPPSLRRGIQFYESAVALDTGFALAWAQLGRARAVLYFASSPSPTLAAEARRAVERAEALAPDRSETRLARAAYERRVRHDNINSLAVLKMGLASAPDDADLLSTAARTESVLGHMDSALVYAVRAQALDPRSAAAAQQLARVLHYQHRYPEALAAYDRALGLNPGNLLLIESQAMVALARGSLDSARSIVRAATSVDPDALAAYFATYWDLHWVLEPAQQRRVLALPIAAFDGSLGVMGLVRTQTHWLLGDSAQARAWADTTRRVFEAELRATPDDAQREVLLGLTLAYLEHGAEAVRHGERGAALLPMKQDAEIGAYIRLNLARIYMLSGRRDKAVDVLSALVAEPWYLTPAWLRIDPTWAPLRGSAQFQALVKPKV